MVQNEKMVWSDDKSNIFHFDSFSFTILSQSEKARQGFITNALYEWEERCWLRL